MAITVLGELRIDGEALSPRERVVLAALVMRTGRPVSADQLADAYWGDRPPATWPKQVQAAVGRLRRRLGANSIVTGPGGYTLTADRETIDAGRFERLVAAGRVHLVAGEPDRAVAALEDALELWRGAPYADLASWPDARAECTRLSELRAQAREDLVQARLDRGGHDAVVADAEHLVAEHPLRERRWIMLATALYRANRQADALAAVRRARQRLGEDLGVDPGRELAALEVAILRHDPALEPVSSVVEAVRAECPYRGLSPFDSGDEQNYFGRDEEVSASLDRLEVLRFLTLSGPSGCGKSSLVRAGIAPSLRRRGLSVRTTTPATQGGTELQQVLAAGSADVLVVDQFEELFHLGLPEDRLTDVCDRLATYPGTVLLTVRSDYLDECAARPGLAPLLAEGVRLVTPMSPAQLRDAIVEPARRSGLRLEHGLVELVLRDAAGAPGILPHVSHAMVETWLRREGPVLTIDGYEAAGGISGAIAQSAERLYQSLGQDQRELCRATLLRLVTPGPDGSPLRQRLRLGPMQADRDREQMLARLVAARLVSTESDSVVVTHEAVASAWPRLRDWLRESADDARRVAALASAAERWEADGQPAEDLYRGGRLEAALELESTAGLDLTPVERRFLSESRRHESARLADLRERARREARLNRRLRGLLGAAVLLLLGSGVTAAALVAANREADRQRESATVEALVARSLALRGSQRDVAALLAAEAYRRWPDDPRARSALMGTLTAAGGFMGNAYLRGSTPGPAAGIPGSDAYLVGGGSEVSVVSTRGNTLASAAVRWSTPDVRVGLMAVSADGTTGVLARQLEPASAPGGPRAEIVTLDLPSLTQRGAPIVVETQAGSLTAAPDGTWAAIGDGERGLVSVIDLEDGSLRRRTFAVDERRSDWAAATLLAATDQGRLVVGGAYDALRVLDPESLRVVREIAVPGGSIDVAVATDGGLIAASGSDRLLTVSLDRGRIRWGHPFRIAHPAPCPHLAVAVEAASVFCGDWFGNLDRHDLRTGLVVESLDPQLGDVGPLLVSQDGSELAAFGAGAPVISRWRLDGSGPVATLVARGSVVYDGWSADGQTFVVARRPARADEFDDLDEFAVWDPERDAATFTLPGKAEGVGWAGDGILVGWSHRAGGVAFVDTSRGEWYRNHPELDLHGRLWPSASGDVAYSTAPDGNVVLVDPETGRPTGRSVFVGGDVHSVSESPDGTRLATASWSDGWTVRVHDVSTGDVLADGLAGPHLVAFAPDGDLYAAQDGRITRHDASDLQRIGTLPGAHGEVNSLQFTRDGSLLLATANDETATLYDVETGLRLGDPIRTAAPLIVPGWLRPEGDLLALTGHTGVALWDLDPARQFAAACRLAGRELTPEEWATYLGSDIRQVATCADVLDRP